MFRLTGIARRTTPFDSIRAARAPALMMFAMLAVGCSTARLTPVAPTGPIVQATATFAGAAPGPGAAAGGTRIAPQDGMQQVYVPAGEFIMGTDQGLTDESPAHRVYLDGFWLDQNEVTNALYRRCVDAGDCRAPSSLAYFDDPQFDRHPVVFVSWVNAAAYCAWAGRRLPTEAEWEKAATWDPAKNVKQIFPWGNEYSCKKGNFDDETEVDASLMPGDEGNCDGFVRTAPVGSFPQGASPYGALDMGGNAWEWVHDAFIEVDPFGSSHANYYAVSPASNPQGVDPAITDYRVMRGGSWNFDFGFGRSTYRLWYGLDDSYDGVGFRCASSG